MAWLFEARKRYGLSVLNYMVTANHVHLLVRDNGGRETIPKSIQLIAGRTAQEFNQRKRRKGAFWEDRYHATAVETGEHLHRCLVYIDLNMVRAGAVKHPSEWEFCGYHEIQSPRDRYRIIDLDGLRELLGFKKMSDHQETHRKWIDESIKNRIIARERKWTESVAVGGRHFVEQTKEQLGARALGREVTDSESTCELREMQSPYKANSNVEIDDLKVENTYRIMTFNDNSMA